MTMEPSESSQRRAILPLRWAWRRGPGRNPRNRPGDSQRWPADLHWAAGGSPRRRQWNGRIWGIVRKYQKRHEWMIRSQPKLFKKKRVYHCLPQILRTLIYFDHFLEVFEKGLRTVFRKCLERFFRSTSCSDRMDQVIEYHNFHDEMVDKHNIVSLTVQYVSMCLCQV